MGRRTADIHQGLLTSFGLSADRCTLTQLRYDLRKMKAQGLLERGGRRYASPLTPKGTRVALLFVLFHKRVCGPLANSLFERRPRSTQPTGNIEAAYHKGDQSIQRIIDLLAA